MKKRLFSETLFFADYLPFPLSWGRPSFSARLRILRRRIFSSSNVSPIMANIIGTNKVATKVERIIPPIIPVPIA